MDGDAGNNLLELVTSWRFREVVRLALDDEGALVEIVRLLRFDDCSVVVGALSALGEALPYLSEGGKFRVLREGFDDLIRLLNSDVPVARRAISILKHLLSSVPLSRNHLVSLVEILSEVAGGENGPILLHDLFELASKPRPIFFDELVEPVRRMVTSDNPNVALLGARLAVTMGIPVFIGWRNVLNALARALRGKNAVAVELALEVVSDLGSLLLEAPILYVIKSLYPPLKRSLVVGPMPSFVVGQWRSLRGSARLFLITTEQGRWKQGMMRKSSSKRVLLRRPYSWHQPVGTPLTF
ncbi:hypothetical protein [Thermococcus sp.]|uniref:hypothetical protein n=1 Tax=Thermococcus sp. TaxID=35749 RepID=UPI00260FD84E|nr:hypothetical protein [Thermococcus sp.]